MSPETDVQPILSTSTTTAYSRSNSPSGSTSFDSATPYWLQTLRQGRDISHPFPLTLQTGQSFTVTRKLAVGFEGALYNAVSESGQRVIVKVYLSNRDGKRHQARSFSRELRALQTIDSHAKSDEGTRLVGFDSNNMILIQRELQGVDLSTHLSTLTQNELELSRLRSLFTSLSLNFYTTYNLVHGDIRPANVMYNPATDGMTLIDFGMTRTIEECVKIGWYLTADYDKAVFEFDVSVLFDKFNHVEALHNNGVNVYGEMERVLREMYAVLTNGRFRKPLVLAKVVQEAEYFGVELDHGRVM